MPVQVRPRVHCSKGFMRILDSHCHIDMVMERGLEYSQIVENLAQNHVSGFIQIGASPDEMRFSRDFAHREHPFDVWYTIGAHPGEAHEIDPAIGIQYARENKTDDKFVAVGEIGLDYHYGAETAERQKEVFIQYLQLAKELKRPVCIHTREAAIDTAQILDQYNPGYGILIHCFTGNLTEMQMFLKLGAYISFSGIVTFKSAAELREAALHCPLDKMLIETDAPYLAPVPHRGKVCEPAFVADTLSFLANLKSIDRVTLASATYHNTLQLYKI